MNFLSLNPYSLGNAPLTPFSDVGMGAMNRLNGAEVASPAFDLMGEMLQVEMSLLNTLRSLMGGSEGGGALNPFGRSHDAGETGTHHEGARIAGGKSIYKHGMFHKGGKGAPNSYAFENSPEGIKFAAKHHYSSIDLDMQITKDGVPVNTHWSQPMLKDGFYDPEHKLTPHTKISEMTLAEVGRLRNRDGESVIKTMSSQIGLLKKFDIAGDLEAKDDRRFATDKIMGGLADDVRSAGIKANLKTINYGQRSMNILREAQAEGFWVRTAEGAGKGEHDFGYGP